MPYKIPKSSMTLNNWTKAYSDIPFTPSPNYIKNYNTIYYLSHYKYPILYNLIITSVRRSRSISWGHALSNIKSKTNKKSYNSLPLLNKEIENMQISSYESFWNLCWEHEWIIDWWAVIHNTITFICNQDSVEELKEYTIRLYGITSQILAGFDTLHSLIYNAILCIY